VPSHPTVDDLTNSSLWEASRQYGSAPADRPAWPVTTANASSSIFKTALALSDSSSTRRKSGGKTVPTHEPRPGLRSCLRLPGNHRNLDLVLGSSPAHPAMIGSIGAQGGFGNGCLERIEHPQQYKADGHRVARPWKTRVSFICCRLLRLLLRPQPIPRMQACPPADRGQRYRHRSRDEIPRHQEHTLSEFFRTQLLCAPKLSSRGSADAFEAGSQRCWRRRRRGASGRRSRNTRPAGKARVRKR
jgi:hypothetical protein